MSISAVDALGHTRDASAAAAHQSPDALNRLAALIDEGETARASGQWKRALTAQHIALELADQVLGGESVVNAIAAQNLAVTYKYIGGFVDAEALLSRALAIAEALDDGHLIATICHNLGGLAHARGDHSVGAAWARRGVDTRERMDDDPLALAGDRGALAGLLIELGAIDDARQLLEAARDTFVELLGDDHIEAAMVDGNLAAIALRRGQLIEAERLARAALAAKQATLGAESPELASTLTTLGVIRRRRGASDEAARLHRQALAVLRPCVDCDHPLLGTIERNLQRAELAAGPVERAFESGDAR